MVVDPSLARGKGEIKDGVRREMWWGLGGHGESVDSSRDFCERGKV